MSRGPAVVNPEGVSGGRRSSAGPSERNDPAPNGLDSLNSREAIQPAPVVDSVLLKQLQGDEPDCHGGQPARRQPPVKVELVARGNEQEPVLEQVGEGEQYPAGAAQLESGEAREPKTVEARRHDPFI